MDSGQRFHSLEDFLASEPSDVDGVLNDGWGASFPVKGREIEATVLFADISAFSTRTLDMSPTATLVYVQTFFAWITAEALQGRPGIVDKYIGDEVMVVYAEEFGSEDPFVDAVQAAAAMSANDFLAYEPHIGIASGPVVVGYAGTAHRYNVSVFGAPVALAARCAGVRPDPAPTDGTPRPATPSSTIAMPAAQWGERDLTDVIPDRYYRLPDGTAQIQHRQFELQPERVVGMKGLGDVTVREIHNTGLHLPSQSAEQRALEGVRHLHEQKRYWPRWETPELA